MYTLSVNGKSYNVDVSADTKLLWVLRDVIGLTGTKYGCGVEICGACTVLIDGVAEKSCDKDVTDAIGKQITTVEGLSPDHSHPLQKAWIANQVPQCGYCQSGMLMAAAGLLKKIPKPKASEITSEIKNVCVCGSYQRVTAAIIQASNG